MTGFTRRQGNWKWCAVKAGFSRLRFRLHLQALEDRTAPATLTVNTTADTGIGSLRNAILFANSALAPGADTIVFDSSVFSSAQTIALTSGQLTISEHLTITGPAVGVTISGSNLSRVFLISGSGTVGVSMSNLTIANGKVAGIGGGISNSGESLSLTDCDIINNSTTGSNSGGGISSAGGSVTLTRCSVTGNQSGVNGGGVDANSGAVVSLTDCTVANNKATSNGGGLGVGSSSLLIERCTLSGNSAASGGGFYFVGAVGASGLRVRNSTLSANSCSINGGGIRLNGFSGTLTVQNSTITANQAGNLGGGIHQTNGGTLSVESSIISGNSAFASADVSNSGLGATLKTTALGSTSGFSFTNLGGNLIGSSILLGPLADNGGPTQTHALLAGSSCIDAGSNPAVLTTDQRGTGAPRLFGSAVDIGAFEARPYVVTNANNSGAGSLRQAVLDANAALGSDTIAFSAAFFATTKTIFLSGEIAVTGPVAIQGPGAALATVNGNNTSRVFKLDGSGVIDVSISGLTITNGNSSASGGGIFSQGENVTLTSCVIANNVAAGADGGGVSTYGGTLVIDRCTIVGNQSSKGGGVNGTNRAEVTIRDTAIIDNKATVGGGALRVNFGVTFVERSTLSGNSATTYGGAIYSYAGTVAGNGPHILRDVTISGNTAQIGGGVFLFGSGTAAFQNCTVTENTSSDKGGGIIDYWGFLSLGVESTILQGNAAPNGPDIFTTGTVSAKNTALGTLNGITTYTNNGGNLIGKNLLLGPLASNGGIGQTHALLVGSPCINTGSNPAAMTTDQRGAGYARTRDGVTDIGAIEYASILVTNALDSGPGSLRQAVLDANASLGYDTINFDPAVFGVPQTITLTSGELLITDPLAIQGPGSALTTVSGNNVGRVFNINGPGVMPATISGLTITGGNVAGRGGGILSNAEDLTLMGCAIVNNITTGGSSAGGGVSSPGGGKLTILNCAIVGNQSSQNGGGIDGNGYVTLVIRDSTISNNKAVGSGGAIGIVANTMLVEGSTISGNTGGVAGGGLYFFGSAGLTFRNSTVSGNTAPTNGGGMALYGAGTVIVQNCTFTANIAVAKGGGISSIVGFDVSVESSIVQGNSAPTGTEIYTPGKVLAKTSALGTIDGITTFTNFGGNLLGADIKLGPLASNGGPMQTHALLSGSACINAGSNPAACTTDQRGGAFARSIGTTDIGAYEYQPGAKVLSVQVNDNSPQRSRVTSLTVTFDSAVTLPTNKADAFQLKRQSDNAVVALSASMMGNAVTLSFTGGPVDFGSLADGRYTLTVLAAQVNGGLLDGNGDGGAGDSYVLVGTPANGLFRLFGDADGNGLVDGLDFGAFRVAFNTNNSTFDFDGSTIVDGTDFGQFRQRFGAVI